MHPTHITCEQPSASKQESEWWFYLFFEVLFCIGGFNEFGLHIALFGVLHHQNHIEAVFETLAVADNERVFACKPVKQNVRRRKGRAEEG